jgi:hypothetical protein
MKYLEAEVDSSASNSCTQGASSCHLTIRLVFVFEPTLCTSQFVYRLGTPDRNPEFWQLLSIKNSTGSNTYLNI